MLDQYYTLHGWDPETGLQRRMTLEELGLPEVVEKMAAKGLLR
jgi:aldehyde:ferredoxin oxidoreductase